MTLNLGFANLVGLLIIIAGVVGFVIAGRRNSSNKSSTRKEE